MKKISILVLFLLLVGCSPEKTNLSKEDVNLSDINETNVDIQKKLTKSDYIDKELVQTIEKIVIEDRTGEILKTIVDNQDLETIINALYGGREVTGTVTSEGYSWCLKMYDNTNSLVLEVFIWKKGTFGFAGNKEYYFAQGNYEILKDIIND